MVSVTRRRWMTRGFALARPFAKRFTRTAPRARPDRDRRVPPDARCLAVRVAIVSDIHGNLPALEAVVADLAEAKPDQVVLGGDLALGGPHAPEVVDRLRELGW